MSYKKLKFCLDKKIKKLIMDAWFSYEQLLILRSIGLPINVYWQNGKEVIITHIGNPPLMTDLHYIGHVGEWKRLATQDEIQRLVSIAEYLAYSKKYIDRDVDR